MSIHENYVDNEDEGLERELRTGEARAAAFLNRAHLTSSLNPCWIFLSRIDNTRVPLRSGGHYS